MTRAVITSFHNYVPMYDHEYFTVISDYYLKNYKEFWRDEVDHLYLLDSNWDFPPIDDPKITVIKTNPHLRYYDAYKSVLPDIKEELVLFMDNDMVISRKGIINETFSLLEDELSTGDDPEEYVSPFDVVSIMDTIGTWKSDRLSWGNKFCPYFFATRKDLLMKYKDIEWGPEMPDFETLGRLTKSMIEDGLKPYEMEDDKDSLYFDGTANGNGKNLGYYHVRAGSTPVYLLTTRKYGDHKIYEDYIRNQPKNEYLRQCAWYHYMGGNVADILFDLDIDLNKPVDIHEWQEYIFNFKKFHGLS